MGQYDKASNDPRSGTVLPQRPGLSRIIELSTAEKLLIFRRRQGWSQSKAAKVIGVHRNTYGRAERGEASVAMVPAVYPLEIYEECLILRRRSGWTQKKCADLMGVTRFWFNVMEKGHVSCSTLEAFWNER